MRAADRHRLLAWLIYTLSGILALQIAIAPGYVAPLYPPAGIGLAAVLIGGRRLLPAVWLGALSVNIVSGLAVDMSGTAWLNPFVVATGAVLQAALGAWMVRRWVGYPSPLDTPRSILRFLLLGGPLACLLNASLSVPCLVAFGVIPAVEGGFSWLNWWAGDTLGVLLFAPLWLVFFARPRALWAARRRLVVYPLLFALLMLGLVIVQIDRWETKRIENGFQRDASALAEAIRTRVEDHLDALQAIERALTVLRTFDAGVFRELSQPWFRRYQGLHVLGWAPYVAAGEREAFVARARHEIDPRFTIFERDAAGNRMPPADAPYYFPIVHAEPHARNAAVIGLNPLAFPPAAEALSRALANDGAAATAPLRLQQEPADQRAVVVYRPVRDLASPGADAPPRGIAYVAMRLGETVRAAIGAQAVERISVCVFDRSGAAPARLFGDAGCEAEQVAAGALNRIDGFDFAGRAWGLRFSASPTYAAAQRGWIAWVALVVNLLAVGMLGAFLLLTSGRTRRVEAMVAQRTRELADSGARLREQQRALARAQEIARLGSWEMELGRDEVHWSEQLQRLLGSEAGPTTPLAALVDRLHADDRATLGDALVHLRNAPASAAFDARFARSDGGAGVARFQIESEAGGERGVHVRGTVQDVTEAREAEEHIQYLAHYDPLTRLPNRSAWMTRVRGQVETARHHGEAFAVLFLDLDQFKTVNDSLGHPIGDRLLSTVAERLHGVLREEDMLARLGGDEFVALLSRLAHPEDAALVARKMIDVLARPFALDNHELSVSASIGIALFPQDGQDVDTLLQQADMAMYSAKDAGRNTYQFFLQHMNDQAQRRLVIESALRRAIERDELALHYQPQVSAADGRIVGYEALLRWQSAALGAVSPVDFIPVAEVSGLILPIGDWVLREACRQQVRWANGGRGDLRVAINISALQFRHSGFERSLAHILAETGARPARIELEITESALMEADGDMVARLATLREMGFTLALDDFGTGYSSLAYLKRFPLQRLKLDRDFVKDLPHDAEDRAISTATLSLARDLGLEVVAEGVETTAQRDFLVAGGCQFLQGYLFGRPAALPACGDSFSFASR